MGILLLLAVVLVIVLILHHREEAKKKAAALALPKPGIAVTIATAKKGSIGVYLDGIGTVTPVYTVSIYTQVDGVVVAVHYTEGQLVNKGDPLIDIDSRPYRATLMQAQGALERDENVLAQARMDLERYRAAWARNGIAKQILDDQEKLVLQDQGVVKNDQGAVQYDQIQVDFCSIAAPIAGRVGLRLDLENERLTEQADLAEYFFELRGQDALQDLYNRTIQADRQSLDLTRALFETGIDNQEAVAQAEVTLLDAEAAGIGIAVNRALYEHAIATLIGKSASTFSMPVKLLTTPVPAIPVGVPSQLLQRRPDIAAAERTTAQANALIGVEQAAYYPALSLTGSGGLQSSAIAKLFSLPAIFWSLGASASETIFDAGLRKATVAQYTAAYNADVAAYRQTVLTAFQQVEDYIATLRILSQQIVKQDAAVKAAQKYLDIATARYQTGLDPYLDVLIAQDTLLGDQQTLVTLRVSEMTAAVELIQALGGGWAVTQLPAASQVTSKDAPRQAASTP